MKNSKLVLPRLALAAALLLPLGGWAADVPANAPNAGASYSAKGADTCLTCHDEEKINGVFHTRHGNPGDAASPFGKGNLQCEACHGPGGNHTKKAKKGEPRASMIRFGRNGGTPVSAQNAMCLGCHEKSVGAAWHSGPHDANDVPCAACHTLHAKKDAVLARSTQPEVCYACHVGERSQFTKPYSHPVSVGKVACSDCHTPHGTTAEKQLVRNTVNDTCYECHAEKRGPFLWEHAPVAENCDNCHAPHGSTSPGMVKSRGPILCQSCHSQQNHPSYPYGPSNLPGGGGPPVTTLAVGNCMNCHSQVHGSNHPSGSTLTR